MMWQWCLSSDWACRICIVAMWGLIVCFGLGSAAVIFFGFFNPPAW